MSNHIIEMHDITKIFRTEDVETHAVSEVSITIDEGEYVAITGPSGCGKSTLLSIMGLLDKPTSGKYLLNKVEVQRLGTNELADLRNQAIGFIFQSFNLIESLNVTENVALPLLYRKDLTRKQAMDKAREALEQIGIAHRQNHYPTQLSGGQQQRVAVARSIVTRPSILLADEPTGNLDSASAETVMKLLKEQHNAGATICIVTHDPRYTRDSTRTIELMDGALADGEIKSAVGL